ncbi:MAG: nucleoside triphosphate pyrophosphohydrolase [Chloroflexi bacterium]|nr:nucleoside triphosphate pyrophosphohydrolase [Chloroflexota bacterium]
MSSQEVPEGELDQFQTLVAIVERLRAPGGCPWDREQTHASLKRNLLEECYEVLEAIDADDPQLLAEELGDLLVQIGFHADIAREAGRFDLGDVLTKINRKLIRRHPHVFGDATVADSREVERNWEKIKEEERREQGVKKSPVDGIPKDLPALTAAQLMQDRVVRSGFDWDEIGQVLNKLSEEVDELRRAETHEEKVHELGDVLFMIVNLSRWLDIHAEDALRVANQRFRWRYLKMEELAAGRGQDFAQLPMPEKDSLWDQAKVLEKVLESEQDKA